MKALCFFAIVVASALAWEEVTTVTGPYTFDAQDGEQRTFLAVDRPTGSSTGAYLVKGWRLEVLDSDLNPIELTELGPDQPIYFHHAVLHEWDRHHTQIVHAAQMIFLASPDMVTMGEAMIFPDNYGMVFRDEDPEWALCCHAYNYSEEELSLYLRWTLLLEEYVPEEHRVVTVQFLGRKATKRDLSTFADDVVLDVSGTFLPGHGPVDLVCFQWHLHAGVKHSVFNLFSNGAMTSLGEVEEEEGSPISNGIEVWPVVYPGEAGRGISPVSRLTQTTVLERTQIVEDLREADMLMVYVLIYASYADNIRLSGDMSYLNMRGHNTFVHI